MKFKKIFSLIILISCLDVNNTKNDFDNTIEPLYKHFEKEINNIDTLNLSIEQYIKELINQKEYINFVRNINNNYYYSIQDTKSSLDFETASLNDSINTKNCIYKYLLIGEKQISLLCINYLYNSLSLYDLSSKDGINNTKIFQVPLSLNLNYSNYVQVSFSAFDEEETKIFIFNDDKIYSIHLRLNYSLDSFKLSYINNFTIVNYTNDNKNLIYVSTTLYHGNRYMIYGYKNGECKIYFLRDKFNDSYISPRTLFKMKHEIYKIYQIQGYLFIIDKNRKKIRILSLLGSNSILVNCYSFNDIIDIAFDYKNNLLYILDNKGNIIIKELALSVSKAYTNTCNSIYSLQIPNYIIQNNNHSKETLKLVMSKNTNIIYIIGKNYLGYINDKFELENYIIYNQNNVLANDIIFSKGNINYLITNYENEIIVYKIEQIKKEQKTTEKSNYKKEKTLYNIIDDNSGVVDCNGNLICKLLFNSFTNNKYVINTLYLTCLIIIISTVYYFKQNPSGKKNYKTFKEDDLDNNEKGNKFSKMFEKMKNIKNFEMFSEYKKRQRNNNINNAQEEYKDKDYYGDEDDNDNDGNEKEEDEEFLEKAYRNYVKGMMKKKMGEDEEMEEEYEEEEEMDNYMDNNQGNNGNKFEERKGHSSDED